MGGRSGEEDVRQVENKLGGKDDKSVHTRRHFAITSS